jgi:hypothetical protein
MMEKEVLQQILCHFLAMTLNMDFVVVVVVVGHTLTPLLRKDSTVIGYVNIRLSEDKIRIRA